MPDVVLDRPTRGYRLSAHGGPEVLVFAERPTRAPGAGEVLIDVEVSGVNFGDTMIRRGEYLRNQPLSMGPGCEVVGRIAAVGPDSGHEPGTRVASWVEAGTGYSDRVVVEGRRAYAVPEELPAASIAAVFLQGVTAHWSVHRFGRMKPGEAVLVHGASGGVGSLAVQLAKLHGGTVVATASSAAKRRVAIEEGADHAFDSTDPDMLTARVREVTGRGCDLVVDGVGGALFMPSLRALAPRGRYVVAGSASQTPATFDARFLLPRNLTVVGFIFFHVEAEDPREPGATLHALCQLLLRDEIRPRVEILPQSEAVEAHRRLDGRTAVGKLILQMD